MMKRNFLRTFIFCLIITAIVAAVFIYSDPKHWVNALQSSFVFSMCIGFSIQFILSLFFHRVQKYPAPVRLGLLLVFFLAGGVIGTEVGVGVEHFIFGYGVPFDYHVRLLSMNLVFAALFGSVAVVYFSLRASAEHMAAKLKEKEFNEERLTRMKTEAELQALQAKINPHFLFNTLNSIASLISENPKAAESTVEKLSELFRYTLRNAERNTVSVGDELDIVRTYLEIEKVRFGERLRYDIRCDAGVRDLTIPALIIQPLVENSIKHGIGPKVDGGTIIIEAKQREKNCEISVIDDGKGLNGTRNEGGFGLKSIEERLRLRYGESASLRIVPEERTHFLITLPLS